MADAFRNDTFLLTKIMWSDAMDLEKVLPYHDTLVTDVTVNGKRRQLLQTATIAAGVSMLELASSGA